MVSRIQTGKSDGLLKHNSIAEIREQDLVRLLMRDQYWRSYFIDIFGIPDDVGLPYLEVLLDGLPDKPEGDIDVLLVPPNRPDFVTVIQIKRVKVKNGKINKLGQFKKGVQQANLLEKIGFAQIYLYVLIVIDSRSQNFGKYSYEGLSSELNSTIDNSITPNGLKQRVGLITFDFIQPMDYPPLSVGAGGSSLIRSATPSPQPTDVTEWVVRNKDMWIRD